MSTLVFALMPSRDSTSLIDGLATALSMRFMQAEGSDCGFGPQKTHAAKAAYLYSVSQRAPAMTSSYALGLRSWDFGSGEIPSLYSSFAPDFSAASSASAITSRRN